jgi:proteasome accessory factor A
VAIVDQTIFGLRNRYSVVFSRGGQREPSAEETGRHLFGPVVSGGLGQSVLLRNGGRLHLEVGSRPEYTTPECASPLDLIVHDKAGERILEGLLADASQRLRAEGTTGDIHMFKRNADPADSSPGCQEDYLAGRGGRFVRLAGILIPFLVTRQLICGAGAVVRTSHGAVYCLSRRAVHIANGPATAAARPRALINTFDEPRAAGLRRLRVNVSDSTMSETTALLRAGATDLVLRMAEAAFVPPDLTLDNPVHAIGEVSQDITGRSLLRLADGRQMNALDIQRQYLANAKDFISNRGADAVSKRVLGLWEKTLNAIGTGNHRAIAREIDWVIKYQLIEQHRAAADIPLSAPEIAQADLAYHDIHRSHSLYYQLQRNGAIDTTARDIDIFEAKTTPPAPNRYRQAG